MTDSAFVFKISRLAYLAVPILALLVIMMMGVSLWYAIGFAVPIALIWWIEHLRTTVDTDGVTAVSTFSTTRLAWDDIAGVRFPKWSSVQAVTTDGRAVRLPSVGFADVPQLSAASGGRLPDPFAAEREARIATD